MKYKFVILYSCWEYMPTYSAILHVWLDCLLSVYTCSLFIDYTRLPKYLLLTFFHLFTFVNTKELAITFGAFCQNIPYSTQNSLISLKFLYPTINFLLPSKTLWLMTFNDIYFRGFNPLFNEFADIKIEIELS
jgi:hypothetical protein